MHGKHRAIALALLPLLAACGKPAPSTPASAPAPGTKPCVALVMKSLANEFFQTMEEGAKQHHAAHAGDYELIAQGIKDETDVGAQVQLVEQALAQKIDALVIAPADSKALIPVCKKAKEAGVTVVNIDNRFDEAAMKESGVRFPFVGPNNRKAAKAVAAFVAKKLAAGDPVAIVEGAPNAFNAQQRRLGFEDAIAEARLKLVTAQSGNWEMDKANKVAAAIVTEHPELKAIFCANDSMALGVVAALRAAGREKSIRVAGFDHISAVRDLLKSGGIVATADQHADQIAVHGVEVALGMLAQRGDTRDEIETPVDLVTAGN